MPFVYSCSKWLRTPRTTRVSLLAHFTVNFRFHLGIAQRPDAGSAREWYISPYPVRGNCRETIAFVGCQPPSVSLDPLPCSRRLQKHRVGQHSSTASRTCAQRSRIGSGGRARPRRGRGTERDTFASLATVAASDASSNPWGGVVSMPWGEFSASG